MTGVKFDHRLTNELVQTAIDHLRSRPDAIAFYERPWLKKSRQLYAKQYNEVFTTENVPSAYFKTIPALQELKDIPVHYYPHHLTHAAAGAMTSPFGRAAIVVADAIGEWECLTIWKWQAPNRFVKMHSISYPHSLGLLYTAFTTLVGLKPNEEEYILMGMAAYGSPIYTGKILREFFIPNELCKLRVNTHRGIRGYLPSANPFDIAASAQSAFEMKLAEIMQFARTLTKEENLVFMGGTALNCLANSNILHDIFKRVWIMPNPGDAGSSLGAALLVQGKKAHWETPYLGNNIDGDYPVEPLLESLLRGEIVGVANGRAEFGPRALGNRSLLADPRGATIKGRVNEIKKRQEFRPFAPVIMEDFAHDFFGFPDGVKTSPYMQYVANCLNPVDYPAIVHVDWTSRVQTVNPDQHPGLYELLSRFYAETGCPMLLNTSLNIRGKPMVDNEADANEFTKTYGIKVFTRG